MSANQVGMTLIKKWEKCRLTAFKPIPLDPWTIGWGATGPNVVEGLVWTQEQADADLTNRVNVLASQVRAAVKVTLNDNQLGALIDFAYNEGIHALQTSTLLNNINRGDFAGARLEFLRWDMAHGEHLQGLENRREDEVNVFNS